eukprot:SM000252S09084  [mRNA]  locus=s252:95066:96003:- [translate_table: standard]
MRRPDGSLREPPPCRASRHSVSPCAALAAPASSRDLSAATAVELLRRPAHSDEDILCQSSERPPPAGGQGVILAWDDVRHWNYRLSRDAPSGALSRADKWLAEALRSPAPGIAEAGFGRARSVWSTGLPCHGQGSHRAVTLAASGVAQSERSFTPLIGSRQPNPLADPVPYWVITSLHLCSEICL